GLGSEGRVPNGLASIESAARAQVRLVEDLLDISRIAAGKVSLQLEAVDLAAILAARAEVARAAATVNGITLDVRLDAMPGPVRGDPARLNQVFENLLSNAIKFTPGGGHITLALERADGTAQVTVSDTGIGIPAHVLPHVFDQFQQADSSITRRYGGARPGARDRRAAGRGARVAGPRRRPGAGGAGAGGDGAPGRAADGHRDAGRGWVRADPGDPVARVAHPGDRDHGARERGGSGAGDGGGVRRAPDEAGGSGGDCGGGGEERRGKGVSRSGLVERSAPRRARQRLRQHLRVDRLHEVKIEPRLERAAAVIGLSAAGERD